MFSTFLEDPEEKSSFHSILKDQKGSNYLKLSTSPLLIGEIIK